MTKWPTLPKSVRCAGGPVKVRMCKRITAEDGDACWGLWDASTRTIRVERGGTPQNRWHTFFHEWMHAVLTDSGFGEMFTKEGNEALCQAVAAARVQEMRGDLGMDA